MAVRLKFSFFSSSGAERVGPHLAGGEFGDMEQARLAAMTAAEKEPTAVNLIDIQADDGSVSEVWILRDGKWERDLET